MMLYTHYDIADTMIDARTVGLAHKFYTISLTITWLADPPKEILYWALANNVIVVNCSGFDTL